MIKLILTHYGLIFIKDNKLATTCMTHYPQLSLSDGEVVMDFFFFYEHKPMDKSIYQDCLSKLSTHINGRKRLASLGSGQWTQAGRPSHPRTDRRFSEKVVPPSWAHSAQPACISGWPLGTSADVPGWPLDTCADVPGWPLGTCADVPGWPLGTCADVPGWPLGTCADVPGWPLGTCADVPGWPLGTCADVPGWPLGTCADVLGWPLVVCAGIPGWPLDTCADVPGCKYPVAIQTVTVTVTLTMTMMMMMTMIQ